MLIFILMIFLLVAAIWYRQTVAKRYADFVSRNSLCYQRLTELNRQYSFAPDIRFDQKQTYDNEKLYDSISCSDLLIYRLQRLSAQILEQANKIECNRQQYQKYLQEVRALPFGQFRAPTEGLRPERLLEIEKQMTDRVLLHPVTQFHLKVTLYRTDLNGQIYDQKSQSFSDTEIASLCKRLHNKTGGFYNDREIWNALCRVERGRVSNKLRFSIYERDGYRCRRCGASDLDSPLEIDHILPISKGGKSTYDNLQTLCRKCNYEKGNR